MTVADVVKWRDAHRNIEIHNEALATMAPFASLYAGDFVTFLEAKGADQTVTSFLRSIAAELAWTYDNWAKAQHAGDAQKLLNDMINNCSGGNASTYAPIRKFIIDYAGANGIALRDDVKPPQWMDALPGDAALAGGGG